MYAGMVVAYTRCSDGTMLGVRLDACTSAPCAFESCRANAATGLGIEKSCVALLQLEPLWTPWLMFLADELKQRTTMGVVAFPGS